jgi:hypothetical protein
MIKNFKFTHLWNHNFDPSSENLSHGVILSHDLIIYTNNY